MEKGAKTKDRTTYQSIPETDSLGRNVFYVIALTVVAGFVEVTGYMDCEGLYASIMTGKTGQKVPTLPEAVLPGISWLTYSIAAAIAAIVNSLTQLTLLVQPSSFLSSPTIWENCLHAQTIDVTNSTNSKKNINCAPGYVILLNMTLKRIFDFPIFARRKICPTIC